MTGAIVGDIAGSSYEHSIFNLKTKRQSLFPRNSSFTDDTVMTCAIAEAMMTFMTSRKTADLHELFVRCMRDWGKRYPDAGYGGRFKSWLKSDTPQSYNSYGNGSAMRVSPVAWFSKTLEEAEHYAKISAEVTHNHPEGIKGAQAVAGAVFLALQKKDKNEIADYVRKYYDLNFSLDKIRPNYKFEVSCQKSVPQAIMCFLESDSFEDAIRNAISLGGDTDTQAAIAGSIAEPFYRIPNGISSRAKKYINDDINAILMNFAGARTEFCFGGLWNRPNQQIGTKPKEKILHDTTLSKAYEKLLSETSAARETPMSSLESAALFDLLQIVWDVTASCRTYDGALKKMHCWVNGQSNREIAHKTALGNATSFLHCLDILFRHNIDKDAVGEYIQRILFLMPSDHRETGQKLILNTLRTFLTSK